MKKLDINRNVLPAYLGGFFLGLTVGRAYGQLTNGGTRKDPLIEIHGQHRKKNPYLASLTGSTALLQFRCAFSGLLHRHSHGYCHCFFSSLQFVFIFIVAAILLSYICERGQHGIGFIQSSFFSTKKMGRIGF